MSRVIRTGTIRIVNGLPGAIDIVAVLDIDAVLTDAVPSIGTLPVTELCSASYDEIIGLANSHTASTVTHAFAPDHLVHRKSSIVCYQAVGACVVFGVIQKKG